MPITEIRTSAGAKLRNGLKMRDRSRRSELLETAAAQRDQPKARNDLVPACPRQMYRTGDLKNAKRRTRKVTQTHVQEIAASIRAHGFVVPILVTSDGRIVDGHARRDAAQRVGLVEIPGLVVDHLTDAELRALSITLNRTAETGEWDLDLLEVELRELVIEGFPSEVLGFSVQEVDGLLTEDTEPVVPQMTDSPSVTRVGDSWRLGPHRVVCGDARKAEVYKVLMEGQHARLLLTDEPYNVPIAGHVTSQDHREFAMAAGEMSESEFEGFHHDWIKPALGFLVDGGLFATFIDWRSVDVVIRSAKALGLAQINFVVWAKTNAGMGSLWRSQHELLPIFKKGSAAHVNNVELGKHARHRSNLWTYPGANTFSSDASKALADHPTPKPVLLLEDALRDVTHREDIVLDPFLGSGSMLLAAERTGRRCRGIELDPLYVDLAVRRWEVLTGKSAMLEETGVSFVETATQRGSQSGGESDV